MIQSHLLPPLGFLIGNQWIAREGNGLPVHNPATGELLAVVPDGGAAAATQAVEAATADINRLTVPQRSELLRGIAARLLQEKDEYARLITLEQGKPLPEAAVEVEYAAGFFTYFSQHLEQLEPRPLPTRVRNLPWTVLHQPAGVAALITPWNFPLAMLAKKLSAALGAGCGVVIKPAELTPLSAMALAETVRQLGGPVNLVTGQPGPIGHVFCEHPLVRVISFTGSTATGRILLQQSAPFIKRLALELGGNAPFIVFGSADLPAAADALIANKFRCAGQTCVCANRIYVERAVEAEFLDQVCRRVAALRVGNGMEPGIDLGPLINRKAWQKVQDHIHDALKKGATRAWGSDPPAPEHDWGCFHPPQVLQGCTETMRVFQEETFGPVVAVSSFDAEDEVIQRANASPYGLSGYVFSADLGQATRVARSLQCGHVGINTGTGPAPEAPFGGMKQSGIGREGGDEGLSEFLETQSLAGT